MKHYCIKIFFLLGMPLFFCFPVHAQLTYEDSLKNLLQQTIHDTLRVKYLLYFADRSDENNRSGARLLIDSAGRVAARSKSKLWQLNVLASKGLLYHNLGISDSAFLLYNQVLAYENDSLFQIPVARVWGNLVNYYRQIGDLKKALRYALKSEKYFSANGKYKSVANVYANIAGILYDLNDNKKALEYDKKTIQLAYEHNFKDILTRTYRNLATVYGENGYADSAMFYYKKSLLSAEEMNDFAEIASSLQSIGVEFFIAGSTDSAYSYLTQARTIYEEKFFFDESYPYLYCYLGKIETIRKNYQLAETYLRKADSSSQSLGYFTDNLEIKKSLKELYAAKGNWQKAFHYQEEYVLMNDSLQRDENTRVTRDLEKKYDTAKKEKENAELKAANELQDQKISSRNIMLVATVTAISLLVLLLFFIFRNYRNERKHVAVLDTLNSRLTQQRDEILNINKLLQLKVLRTQMNPHFIYNCLNAINNLVMKGDSDKASNYLLNFSKLLRMILDFSDKTFVDLDDEIKFINLYLSLEAMRMGSDFTYEVKASNHILEDDIAIPSLLIQPFIENAIWHGLSNKEGNKKLTVSFEDVNDNHHLKCIVEDNGIGREKAAENKNRSHTMLHESKGIKITKERMELLRYQIKNEVSINIKDMKNSLNESEGTKIELVLPTQN